MPTRADFCDTEPAHSPCLDEGTLDSCPAATISLEEVMILLVPSLRELLTTWQPFPALGGETVCVV